MTFTKKDYDDLKNHLGETIDISLRKYKVDTIEKLPEERKNPLKFLSYVTTTLDMEAESPKPNFNDLHGTLYAAMILSNSMIKEGLGLLKRSFRSQVSERLESAVETAETAKMDLKNKFRLLNNFFNRIYVENDSARGIDPSHPMCFVPHDYLKALIQHSYRQEVKLHTEALGEFTRDGEACTPLVINNSKSVKIKSSSVEWSVLHASLKSLIKDQLAEKNKAELSKLDNKERAAQLHYLETLAAVLDSSTLKDAGKAVVVLMGAMLIVRELIAQEYSRPLLEKSELPSGMVGIVYTTGSLTHKKITEITGIKEMPVQQIELLVQAAYTYTRQLTTVDTKFRVSHPFSRFKDIPLEAILNLAQELIMTCRSHALTEASKEHAAYLEAVEKGRRASSSDSEVGLLGGALGLFSGFFTAKAPPRVAVAEAEEEALEAAAEAPAAGGAGR